MSFPKLKLHDGWTSIGWQMLFTLGTNIEPQLTATVKPAR